MYAVYDADSSDREIGFVLQSQRRTKSMLLFCGDSVSDYVSVV